jgi:hypothetical protein
MGRATARWRAQRTVQPFRLKRTHEVMSDAALAAAKLCGACQARRTSDYVVSPGELHEQLGG